MLIEKEVRPSLRKMRMAHQNHLERATAGKNVEALMAHQTTELHASFLPFAFISNSEDLHKLACLVQWFGALKSIQVIKDPRVELPNIS
jgi:hypothetical protein